MRTIGGHFARVGRNVSGFVKIYGKILKSSVWVGQPAHLRLTWIALLVLADRKGDVMSSVPGLAQDAGVTIPEVLQALDVFKKPDPFSRTPDNEGRRIIEIDGGWKVLNHDKYREMRSESQVKNAERQAKFKAKKRAAPSAKSPAFEPVASPVTDVTGNNGNAPLCTLYSDPDQSLEDPDPSDPDPIPSDRPKDPRARTLPPGVFDAPVLQAQPAQPAMTLEVPEWWTGPKPRHAVRAREAGLDVTTEADKFRVQHFQVAFPATSQGVDKRFDRWLIDAKVKAETDRAKQLAVTGAKPPRASLPGLPDWVLPEHATFAIEHSVKIEREWPRFKAKYHLPVDSVHRNLVREPFMAHLQACADAGARRRTGSQ
jgi:hypothetical protein